jgi:alkylation response protein AidB-like acyl-CoA dehydrogenase
MFELSETQRALQEAARKLAKKEIAPHAAEVDRTEQRPGLWA